MLPANVESATVIDDELCPALLIAPPYRPRFPMKVDAVIVACPPPKSPLSIAPPVSAHALSVKLDAVTVSCPLPEAPLSIAPASPPEQLLSVNVDDVTSSDAESPSALSIAPPLS